ncbi:MAG: hypothetical protein A2036_01055 [Omnitrophica bacterium GWA2_50_21]|nr:MAG: hypothetical protein A2036_01055 [Omnitrophica bacterium GWA2_50_21]
MKAWMVAAVISAVCYGINNILLKLTNGRISDALGAVCIQTFSLAVIVGYFLLIKMRGEAVNWSYQGIAISMSSGIMMGFGLVLLLTAFKFGGPVSGVIPVLLSGQIVLAALAGFLLFREGLSAIKAIGILCCFLGIWLSSR